ncbi:hypothetical protein [Sphingomicrobium arenosum]|uniref:hypothetical protein n=1 Tax=Sphingomicrobium arenosum TaxID=2233861 RepID=UPI0022401392|nr:hypothetical protein [Sphingomicrobium arenosum]
MFTVASLVLSMLAVNPAQPDSAPEQAEEQVDDDKKICRRISAATGSRMSRQQRVCKTQREWRASDEAARKDADRLR